MKKTSLLLVSLFLFTTMFSFAQDTEKKDSGYVFTEVVDLESTCVKDQNRSGTCWSFSTLSFFESELIRMGKDKEYLSPMFIVWHAFAEKAVKYVRLHGNMVFGSGGAFTDVQSIIKNHGIVPFDVYKGLNYAEEGHAHSEFEKLLTAYVNVIIKNPNRKLSTAWLEGFKGILDAYLGEVPEEFTYNGKEYTPQSYAKELGFNMDDYVSITSYTHHPFYETFAIEVPDNWINSMSYNVPLNEMIEIMDNALNTGYSVAWGSDVSEKGFQWRKGFAIVPEDDITNMEGSEKLKWESMTEKEMKKKLGKYETPGQEKVITQELRQEGYDNYTTQDDHGMHMTGIAKDQNGTKYYIVKNSWGVEDHVYKGIFYVSEAFVKYKTMNYMIHKDAIPKHIKKKLGL